MIFNLKSVYHNLYASNWHDIKMYFLYLLVFKFYYKNAHK